MASFSEALFQHSPSCWVYTERPQGPPNHVSDPVIYCECLTNGACKHQSGGGVRSQTRFYCGLLPYGSQGTDTAPPAAGSRPVAYSCFHTSHRGVPDPHGPSTGNSLNCQLYSCRPPLEGHARQRRNRKIISIVTHH